MRNNTVNMRYKLSWLLSLPVLLALAVWWLKPPAHASYAYLAEPLDVSRGEHESYYCVKRVYIDRHLLHSEIKDCEYAVVMFGAEWSLYDQIIRKNLLEVSKAYEGRVPFFICSQNDYLADMRWFPATFEPSMKTIGVVCVVHRGAVVAQLTSLADHIGVEYYQNRLNEILPWNYSL